MGKYRKIKNNFKQQKQDTKASHINYLERNVTLGRNGIR
jgi:hypothetical protein